MDKLIAPAGGMAEPKREGFGVELIVPQAEHLPDRAADLGRPPPFMAAVHGALRGLDELPAGETLLCCSRPRGPVVPHL